MNLPIAQFERSLFTDGNKHVIAIDEVGMGSLAGPVVVCAVVVDARNLKKLSKIKNVRDSKTMSPKQRETCASDLIKAGIEYKISYCYPNMIDKINVYQASRHAMRRAVNKVQSENLKIKNGIVKFKILVDGNKEIPKLKVSQRAIVKGDSRVFSIACASILAKVYRDKMMRNYAKRYPNYRFDLHKGYGTKLHQAMLAQFGPCEIHRKSFNLSLL